MAYFSKYFAPSYFAAHYFSGSVVGFPTQYLGLKYFNGMVKDLCLVALVDAPSGNQLRINKNGVDYALYLVPTSDPDASEIRINTSSGIMAIRLKT